MKNGEVVGGEYLKVLFKPCDRQKDCDCRDYDNCEHHIKLEVICQKYVGDDFGISPYSKYHRGQCYKGHQIVEMAGHDIMRVFQTQYAILCSEGTPEISECGIIFVGGISRRIGKFDCTVPISMGSVLNIRKAIVEYNLLRSLAEKEIAGL